MPSTTQPSKTAAAEKRTARQTAREAAERAAARSRRRTRIWVGTAILAGLIVATVIVVAVIGNGARTAGDTSGSSVTAPTVGGDLHTVAAIGGTLYVGGHQAVARSLDGGRNWEDVPALANADAMGWAVTSDAILIGGHPGLFTSTDGGETFTQVSIDFSDVHAIGGVGETVYAGSPQAGLLASNDGGTTWEVRNAGVGQSFMGTMLVDPEDPARIIAPDMASGLVTSTDGGQTWSPLGGPSGAMAAAWNPTDTDEVLAVGMDAGALTRDGGATWNDVPLPSGTSAVAYSEDGAVIYAGVLQGVQAHLFASTDGGATWEPTS